MNPEADLAITDARVITGTGEVLENGTVLIKGNKILSIKEDAPELVGIQQIDGEEKTVLPGLIDAHVHLTIPATGRDSMALDQHLKRRAPNILKGFLENGVTTVRSTGEYWPWINSLQKKVSMGKIDGPSILTSGPIFTAERGHPVNTVCTGTASPIETLDNPDPYCRNHLSREVNNPKEARSHVRQLAEEGVDFIKVVSDSVMAPVQIKDELVKAIVEESQKEDLKTVAHVHTADLMKKYAEMGMDGFVHPPHPNSIPSGDLKKFANILANQGTPITTTLSATFLFRKNGTNQQEVEAVLNGDSPRQKFAKTVAQEVANFADAGVPLVVGTDWWSGIKVNHPAVQPGTITHTEMKMLRWGGMSRETIVKAATVNAAKALGVSDRIGTLESGKLADLIIVDGNPLENLEELQNVEKVVKRGEIVVQNEKSN